MAKAPTKDDDEPKRTPKSGNDDLKTEQEKAPENTQNTPYPTGNPPPARNHLGQPIDEDGNLIEKEEKA